MIKRLQCDVSVFCVHVHTIISLGPIKIFLRERPIFFLGKGCAFTQKPCLFLIRMSVTVNGHLLEVVSKDCACIVVDDRHIGDFTDYMRTQEIQIRIQEISTKYEIQNPRYKHLFYKK